MSEPYKLDKEDLMKILRAFLWSLASAVVAGLIYLFSGAVELPVWVVPLVPVVNAILYGVWQYIKDKS